MQMRQKEWKDKIKTDATRRAVKIQPRFVSYYIKYRR